MYKQVWIYSSAVMGNGGIDFHGLLEQGDRLARAVCLSLEVSGLDLCQTPFGCPRRNDSRKRPDVNNQVELEEPAEWIEKQLAET